MFVSKGRIGDALWAGGLVGEWVGRGSGGEQGKVGNREDTHCGIYQRMQGNERGGESMKQGCAPGVGEA